nr:ribonuclease H-like domain-containing protein [Tanacetum cinerariifolium]
MEQPNPTFAKIPILDTRKFKQWKFKIQQYLKNEYYALWEVIKFGDSYEAPKDVSDTGSASKGSAKKKGRTIAVTTEDMQKRRNDVKARTTLLLALLDEHQLRFSKYKTAQELWAAILKTFGGNETTKKTKKNYLKQQYGNFKAEGKETLEQTFNRLQAIVSHLEFMDIEIEQDDMNQKFLTSLAPEWLIYMANEEEDHALVDDHEALTEFTLMAKSNYDNEDFHRLKLDWLSLKIKKLSSVKKIRGLKFKVESKDNRIERLTKELEELKKEKEGLDSKLIGFQSASKDLDTLIRSQRSDKNKEGLGYSDVPPSCSIIILFPETRESSSSILSKLAITFVKAADSPTGNSQNVIDDKGYWDSGCSRHMTGNISYLSDYEPYDGGYVSFGQGGGKITGKVIIKTECIVLGRDFKLKDDTNVLLRTPRQHNMYSIDLNNIVPHKDLTCLVAKASADECMLWHRKLGKEA